MQKGLEAQAQLIYHGDRACQTRQNRAAAGPGEAGNNYPVPGTANDRVVAAGDDHRTRSPHRDLRRHTADRRPGDTPSRHARVRYRPDSRTWC
jgi:hypothetical protein